LYSISHAPKKGGYWQSARAGAVAKTAPNTGGHHVRHPDEMEDQRVGWHANFTLSIRPPQELISIVLEDRCPENALLTVTDRASHHAIVASNAGGKTVQKGWEILDDTFELLKKGITLLRPLSDDFIDYFTP